MAQEFVYASKFSPTLGTTLDIDGKTIRIKFEKKVYKTTDERIAAALDEQIANGGALAMHVHRVDRSAAEQLARDFLARKAAAKGGYSTANLAELVGQPMAASAVALGEMAPNNPEGLQEFADALAGGNMTLTEFVHEVAQTAPPGPQIAPSLPTGKPAGVQQPHVAQGLNLFGQRG